MSARLAVFVGVAFGWSWAWWIPLAVHGAPVDFGVAAPAYVAGIAGPLLGAVAATTVCDGQAGLADLVARLVRVRVAWRWYAVAVGVPVLLLGVAVLLMGAPRLASFGVAAGLPAMHVGALWCYAVLWNGIGEEAGWRGFLLPLLLDRLSPLAATGVVSLVWAAWHLPLLRILTSFAVLRGAGDAAGVLVRAGLPVRRADLALLQRWRQHPAGRAVARHLQHRQWHGRGAGRHQRRVHRRYHAVGGRNPRQPVGSQSAPTFKC